MSKLKRLVPGSSSRGGGSGAARLTKVNDGAHYNLYLSAIAAEKVREWGSKGFDVDVGYDEKDRPSSIHIAPSLGHGFGLRGGRKGGSRHHLAIRSETVGFIPFDGKSVLFVEEQISDVKIVIILPTAGDDALAPAAMAATMDVES
jgi:hypothetical protein